MTRDETKIVLATLAEVYPKNLAVAVSETTVNVWFQLLQDIAYVDIKSVMGNWLKSQKYPPSIADIRKGAANSAAQLQIGTGKFSLDEWLHSPNPQWVDVAEPVLDAWEQMGLEEQT